MTAQTNYTPELTAQIVEDYEGGKDVEAIAEAIGKSVRSVRSKLVREGVYVAQPKAAKAVKVEGPTKKEMLRELEELAPFDVSGFMGATKAAIGSLIDHLREEGAESVAEDTAQPEGDETQPEAVADNAPDGWDVAETAVDKAA